MSEHCPSCGRKDFQSCVEPCEQCGWEDPVLGSWVTAGWYANPADPGTARYWNGARWVGKARKDMSRKPPPVKPMALAESEALHKDALVVLENWIVLGGHGTDLAPHTSASLRFDTTGVQILGSDAVMDVPYGQVEALEVTSEPFDAGSPEGGGAAFLSGGFIGAMEIRRLNALVARSNRLTVLRLQTRALELFLTRPDASALNVRIELSAALGLVRAARPAARPQAPPPA